VKVYANDQRTITCGESSERVSSFSRVLKPSHLHFLFSLNSF
jgi:hypothetical protein